MEKRKGEGLHQLILASASPRRRELLGLITENFSVAVADTDEAVLPGEVPEELVTRLARQKALAVLAEYPGHTVIGSDTVVVLEGEILGKPRDEAHAADMLGRLSGHRHRVYTGVAIARAQGCDCFVEHTEVEFAPLSREDISAYIATGEPMDKAGAYGIQGKGALFIRSISGDYYTVMGLPVCRLAEKLRDIGVRT